MDLTIISFVIAVLGIAIQMADAFPEHRETRKAIVILSIGVCLGMVASALAGAKYNITGNVDAKYAILLGLIALAAIFGLLAVFANDVAKRDAAMVVVSGSAMIFVLAGFVVALSEGIGAQQRYSTDEIMLLATAAEQRQQYELAIERLNQARGRLGEGPARLGIEKRIARLEALQGEATNSASAP